jgi:hypothetical protein
VEEFGDCQVGGRAAPTERHEGWLRLQDPYPVEARAGHRIDIKRRHGVGADYGGQHCPINQVRRGQELIASALLAMRDHWPYVRAKGQFAQRFGVSAPIKLSA